MITKNIKILILAILLLANTNGNTQNKKEPVNRILFIFDASQSMLGRWQSGRKIDIAKDLLNNMVDSLKYIKNLEIGLRVYGHKSSVMDHNCEDTKLEIGFFPANIISEKLKIKLDEIKANGTTPIGKSLIEGAKDFKDFPNDRNIIILITDGEEACGKDPCEVSLELQKKGIVLNENVRLRICKEYKSWYEKDCLMRVIGLIESPIRGPKGNKEYLIYSKNYKNLKQ